LNYVPFQPFSQCWGRGCDDKPCGFCERGGKRKEERIIEIGGAEKGFKTEKKILQ
jgi:hypothetical protein